jgi:hypothetical protein
MLLLVSLSSGPVLALPASIDADNDGHVDGIETALGANPNDAGSTPESLIVPPTCLDGVDNDGDGATDLDDPECTQTEVPPPAETTFPAAGDDKFESSLMLDEYPLDTPFGLCRATVEADGPTVVMRGAPADLGGGLREIDVEIIAMQLTGTATILADPGCGLPAGEVPVTVFEDPAQASSGKVTDTTPDPATDFPAESFFDIFFQIDTPVGILPGGPPNGPAGDPVHVENEIHTIPPYHGGKNTLCYEVPGLTHQHCPKAPPDHHTCYKAKFSPKFSKRTVTLRDQFDADTGSDHRVLKPQFFCNPASKNGEPLYEPTGHLTCYRLQPKKAKQRVLVRNQFGLRTVKTKKSQLLCVPSEKNTEGAPQQLDHFKCYNGQFKPKLQKRDITLVDQFGILETRVLKSLVLCNPVSKNGEPIASPLNHLECFKLRPKKVRQTVTMRDQFGEQTVKTKKAVMVCAPSSKTEVTVTTSTTIPSETTTTTTSTPTTTLPGGGLEVTVGYNHVMPGLSVVCGLVFGPPNAMGTVSVTGPGTDETVNIMTDGSGVANFQVDIFSFGDYMVTATIGTQMGIGNVTVGPAQSTCPTL